MNKADAAKYLGVSVRTLERYTSERRLSPRRVRTKTGPALDYDLAHLDTFKVELEASTGPFSTAPTSPVEGSTEDVAMLARVEPQVLAEGGSAASGSASGPVEMLARLVAALGEAGAVAAGRPHVATSEKLLLDLSEAAALTGLSRAHLRAAIAAGELSAKKMGRGWKMRRADLEKYLDGAFGEQPGA